MNSESLGNPMSYSAPVEDRSRHVNLMRTMTSVVLMIGAMVSVGSIVALFLVEDFSISALVVAVIAMLSMLAVNVLLARERFALAFPLGIVSLTAIQFTTMYFLNGTRGPMPLFSLIIIMIAGVIGQRRYTQPTVIVHITLYLVFVLLEAVGVLVPYQMAELSSRLIWAGLFILAMVSVIVINWQFIAQLGFSLTASLQREEALAEMSRQLQASADTQRLAQQQALETARQLQDVAQQYVAFLENITAGNYSTALDLDVLAEQPNLPQALITLGEYINTTVASLVSALQEAQRAQQTYIRQSWEGLMGARRTPGGYRYRAGQAGDAPQVEVDEGAWLPPMTRALQSKDVTVAPQELALPIASGTRAQLIGALGVRREGSEAWSEDELALVTTVTDQLAQTLENLRLLDETTRRAAREQMAGEITGRIREAVEIEAVLERALSELGRAFAAERGTAYLALNEQEEA